MTISTRLENSTVSSQPYLQQCLEDLKPETLSSWQSQSTQWQVAAVATLVAYTALAIGGLAATVFYIPIYLPIVAISSAFLLKYVQQLSDSFEKWSDQASARVEQIKLFSQEFQALSSSTPQQIQQTLQEKGIQSLAIPGMAHNSVSLDSLKPLIARHVFWEKHIQKLEVQKNTLLIKASKLVAESYDNNKEKIYTLNCQALEIEKTALTSKIKNAFVNAVIRRPNYQGSLETLGKFSTLSGREHAIGNAASPNSANEFFAFKSGGTPTITIDEVKRMGISDLAMRLLSGMPA